MHHTISKYSTYSYHSQGMSGEVSSNSPRGDSIQSERETRRKQWSVLKAPFRSPSEDTCGALQGV